MSVRLVSTMVAVLAFATPVMAQQLTAPVAMGQLDHIGSGQRFLGRAGGLQQVALRARIQVSRQAGTADDPARDGMIEVIIRKSQARGWPMPRMPGKDDGRKCPDGMTKNLQSEDRGSISDRSADNMAGYDNDSTPGHFVHFA